MTEGEESSIEGLPRPVPQAAESTPRHLRRIAALLIGLGWIAGLGVAALSVYCAVVVLGGEPERIPRPLLDEWLPAFRDRPTFSGLLVGVVGLLVSLVPVLVVAGMGHLLRLFLSLEESARRILRKLEERA
jgi:hypothetical protein